MQPASCRRPALDRRMDGTIEDGGDGGGYMPLPDVIRRVDDDGGTKTGDGLGQTGKIWVTVGNPSRKETVDYVVR